MGQIQTLKKGSKLFFLVFLFVIILSSLGSSAKTLPQSESSRICHAVRVDGGVSNNVFCNISIDYSNGTSLVPFVEMEDLGDKFCYNLSSSQTAIKGFYRYEVSCNNGSLYDTQDYEYLVNLGGVEPSPERTSAMTRSIFIFLGIALLFFISLFFVRSMPVRVTMFLLMIWFILMGVNSAYISIQDEVVNTSIEGFFSFFLVISFWANYAIFSSIILLWIFTIVISSIERRKVNLIKDYG